MKTILVTGGCGFIGTNLVLNLCKDINNKIIVIDNLWRGTDKYIKNIQNVKIIKGDLTDYNLCLNYIKNAFNRRL